MIFFCVKKLLDSRINKSKNCFCLKAKSHRLRFGRRTAQLLIVITKAEIYNSYRIMKANAFKIQSHNDCYKSRDLMKANAFTMIITRAEIYNSYCKMKVDAFIMMIISKLYQNFIV